MAELLILAYYIISLQFLFLFTSIYYRKKRNFKDATYIGRLSSLMMPFVLLAIILNIITEVFL